MSYVAFQLSRLNEHNGAFKFESLARDLIHGEYCRNLVPATGPAARGDRGQDARTHTNYILDSDDLTRLYTGAPRTDQRIVFAFSINQEWKPKLRSDVEKIKKNELPHEKIVFVTNQPIQTRDQQEAAAELSSEFAVEVEILDASWILQYLERDHYSLAITHLGCDPSLDPNWRGHSEQGRKWTIAGLTEDEASMLEDLTDRVRYRSDYEGRERLLVLDLKGIAELLASDQTRLEESFRWYEEALRECARVEDPQVEMDVLFHYCFSLWRNDVRMERQVQLTERMVQITEERQLHDRLTNAAAMLMYLAPGHTTNDTYRQLVTRFREVIELLAGTTTGPYERALISEARMNLEFLSVILGAQPGEELLRSIDYFIEAVSHVQYFNVMTAARQLAMLTTAIGDPELATRCEQLQEMAIAQEGTYVRGGFLRDQGLAYLHSGQTELAIDCLMEVKQLWMDAAVMRGYLLATLILGEAYASLHLHAAARYQFVQCYHFATVSAAFRYLDLAFASFEQLYSVSLAEGRVDSAFRFALYFLRGVYLYENDIGREKAEEARQRVIETLSVNMTLVLMHFHSIRSPRYQRLYSFVQDNFPDVINTYEFITTSSDGEEDPPEWVTNVRAEVEKGNFSIQDLDIKDEQSDVQQTRFEYLGISFEWSYTREYSSRVVAESLLATFEQMMVAARDLIADLPIAEHLVQIQLTTDVSQRELYLVRQLPESEALNLRISMSPSFVAECFDPQKDRSVEMITVVFAQVFELLSLAPSEETLKIVEYAGARILSERRVSYHAVMDRVFDKRIYERI